MLQRVLDFPVVLVPSFLFFRRSYPFDMTHHPHSLRLFPQVLSFFPPPPQGRTKFLFDEFPPRAFVGSLEVPVLTYCHAPPLSTYYHSDVFPEPRL